MESSKSKKRFKEEIVLEICTQRRACVLQKPIDLEQSDDELDISLSKLPNKIWIRISKNTLKEPEKDVEEHPKVGETLEFDVPNCDPPKYEYMEKQM